MTVRIRRRRKTRRLARRERRRHRMELQERAWRWMGRIRICSRRLVSGGVGFHD